MMCNKNLINNNKFYFLKRNFDLINRCYMAIIDNLNLVKGAFARSLVIRSIMIYKHFNFSDKEICEKILQDPVLRREVISTSGFGVFQVKNIKDFPADFVGAHGHPMRLIEDPLNPGKILGFADSHSDNKQGSPTTKKQKMFTDEFGNRKQQPTDLIDNTDNMGNPLPQYSWGLGMVQDKNFMKINLFNFVFSKKYINQADFMHKNAWFGVQKRINHTEYLNGEHGIVTIYTGYYSGILKETYRHEAGISLKDEINMAMAAVVYQLLKDTPTFDQFLVATMQKKQKKELIIFIYEGQIIPDFFGNNLIDTEIIVIDGEIVEKSVSSLDMIEGTVEKIGIAPKNLIIEGSIKNTEMATKTLTIFGDPKTYSVKKVKETDWHNLDSEKKLSLPYKDAITMLPPTSKETPQKKIEAGTITTIEDDII